MGKVSYTKTVSDGHLKIVLQRIADVLDKDVTVHSGDRDFVPKGGSRKSLHLAHRAADFHVTGISDAAAYDAIKAALPKIFDRTEGYELIRHGVHTDTGGPHLHVGHYAGNHTGQVLLKTEGLTPPGGHYDITAQPIGVGTPQAASAPPPVATHRPPTVNGQPARLRSSVGVGGRNFRADVIMAQALLNRARRRLYKGRSLANHYNSLREDGICGPKTKRAIHLFQWHIVGFRPPDSRIDPGGRTLRTLNLANEGSPVSVPARVSQNRRAEDQRVAVQGGANSISAEQLARIAPNLRRSRAGSADAVTAAVNLAMSLADINTPARMAGFLAQIVQESDGLNTAEEYASGADYEGRVQSLGNTERGDGRRFKGRGFIQLTGRRNYTGAGADPLGCGIPRDLVSRPEWAATLDGAARVSAWFWKRNNINRLCDQLPTGDESSTFLAISRAVNAPSQTGARRPNGWEERQRYYRLAKRELGITWGTMR